MCRVVGCYHQTARWKSPMTPPPPAPPPRAATAPMMTAAMRARNKPYSTAVAPVSALRRKERLLVRRSLFMSARPFVERQRLLRGGEAILGVARHSAGNAQMRSGSDRVVDRGERGVDLLAQGHDNGDDDGSDEGDQQAVLNGGGAALVRADVEEAGLELGDGLEHFESLSKTLIPAAQTTAVLCRGRDCRVRG